MCLNHHFPLSPQASLGSVVRDTPAADHASADDVPRGFGELIAEGEPTELNPSAVPVTQAVS